MSTITTRSGKGSPLTNNEVDTNFTNLNTDKLESADLAGYATLSGATFTGEVEATGFNGDLTGAILFKGQAGEALTKGDPVYISGISGNKTVVSKADANDANKMPCFGIVDATVSANADCSVVTFGTLQGLDTSSFSEGDELFVSDTGTLTTTAPTGESSQIQKIGKVTRSHASTGSIKVMGAGRTNAVPNLNDGQFFLGNGSNQAVSTDFTTSVLGEISAGTGIGISGSGVISNSAPDQTVSLTGAGTTTVSGTYPNFTITGAGTTYTAGTGITLTGTQFSLTDTNAKLNLTGGTVTGRTTFTDGISLEPNDGIRFGGTADIHLRALTNNANSAIDLSGGSLSIGGVANTVWHKGNDDVLVKEDSTGFVPLYRTGTSGDQTIVAVVGSNSLRPVLQFSESTGTSITSGMSLEYNGVGSGDTNYMAFNSVAGSPVHKFYSGGLIETDGTVQCNTSWNEPMIRHGSSGPFARSDGNYIYWDGGGTSSLYYINGFGGITTDSKVTITDDDGLVIRSSTNAAGAPIEFSDAATNGTYGQKGTLTYYHADTMSYGSGNAFVFGSTEASTSVVGNKAIFDNFLIKPSSGTGAGTLLVDSSRNITANYVKADRLYANDDGSTGYFYNDSGTRVAYTGGDFYIQSGVGNYYNYATNQYIGNTSGDTIYFRGNSLTHNGWNAEAAGHFRLYDNKYLKIGSGSDVEHFWNGSNYYTDINGGAVWYIRDGNSSNNSRFMMDVDNGNFHADGNIYAYSTSVSDEKLKKDINKVENALDKVSQLNGYEFTYLKDNKRSAGVIAQEVEKVLPQAVGEDELMHLDGDEEKYKYVEYNQLVALLIESIKELKAEIEELKGAK